MEQLTTSTNGFFFFERARDAVEQFPGILAEVRDINDSDLSPYEQIDRLEVLIARTEDRAEKAWANIEVEEISAWQNPYLGLQNIIGDEEGNPSLKQDIHHITRIAGALLLSAAALGVVNKDYEQASRAAAIAMGLFSVGFITKN